MSGTRRQHAGPRRDRATPNARRIPRPAPRPSGRLTGGPLDSLIVHVDRHVADLGWMPAGGGGRYVRVDADELAFERDHQPGHAS